MTAICYTRIGLHIWRRVGIGAMTQQQRSNQIQSKRRTIKMLITVVVVFAICWLPVSLLNLFLNIYIRGVQGGLVKIPLLTKYFEEYHSCQRSQDPHSAYFARWQIMKFLGDFLENFRDISGNFGFNH